jgi:hypothetical protein
VEHNGADVRPQEPTASRSTNRGQRPHGDNGASVSGESRKRRRLDNDVPAEGARVVDNARRQLSADGPARTQRSVEANAADGVEGRLPQRLREAERAPSGENRARRQRPDEDAIAAAKRQTIDATLVRLRNSVMLRGYFLTSIVWPMTTSFRDFSHDEHATIFEYLAWCRDHLLAFARCEQLFLLMI